MPGNTGRAILTGSCRGKTTLGCRCDRTAMPRVARHQRSMVLPRRTRTWECTDELRPRSGTFEEGLGGKPALEGHQAWLFGRGSRAPARLAAYRAHAGTAWCREVVEADQRRAVCEHAG